MDLFESAGDDFSDCGAYRYALWKWWCPEDDPQAARVCVIMLNPSTATRDAFDPTATRCERRARRLGYGGVILVNLFPLVATDPAELVAHPDPLGDREQADFSIRSAVRYADLVIVGWGTHGSHRGRDRQVVEILREEGVAPVALGVNADGSPRHPLYVGYDVEPEPWRMGGT